MVAGHSEDVDNLIALAVKDLARRRGLREEDRAAAKVVFEIVRIDVPAPAGAGELAAPNMP